MTEKRSSGGSASASTARGDELRDLLGTWASQLRVLQVAHGIAGERDGKLARVTGALVAVLTSVVGTALLVSAVTSEHRAVRYGSVALSLLAAVLGIVQITLNHPELAVRHRQAYLEYGRLHRQLEVLRARTGSQAPAQPEVEALREAWSRAEEDAPVVPGRLRSAALRRIRKADVRGGAPDVRSPDERDRASDKPDGKDRAPQPATTS